MSETLIVDRKEDMSSKGFLRLFAQPDGDMIVSVTAVDMYDKVQRPQSVEFCTSGGRSHRTLRALRELAVAMAMENNDPSANESARHEYLGEEFLKAPLVTELTSIRAQLAAESKRADDLCDKLDNVCGQLETLRRAEIRTSDLREQLAAAEARAKGLVEACEEFRADVLHGLDQFDNDQTNAVLGLFDVTIGPLLPAGEEAKDAQ